MKEDPDDGTKFVLLTVLTSLLSCTRLIKDLIFPYFARFYYLNKVDNNTNAIRRSSNFARSIMERCTIIMQESTLVAGRTISRAVLIYVSIERGYRFGIPFFKEISYRNLFLG